MADPASPPGLSEADLRFYAEEFARTGAHGGLSWYRNVGPNWELLAPFAGLRVEVPALYLVGDRDLVLAFRGMDRLAAGLHASAPRLRETVMLPGCGHWTQQERAEEVNAALIGFLHGL